jgi:hypothetical protein
VSTKHRGRIEGAPVTQKLPTPAGGVKLETFVPWRLVQRGIRRAVIAPPGAPKGVEVHSTWAGPARTEAKDTALMRALGLAHHWQRLLHEGRAASVVEIAQAEQIDITQVRRLLRLTLLAPTVIETLLREPQHRLDPVLRQPWATLWQDQCSQLKRLHRRGALEESSRR